MNEWILWVAVWKAYYGCSVNSRKVGYQETKDDVMDVSVVVGSTVNQPSYHVVLEEHGSFNIMNMRITMSRTGLSESSFNRSSIIGPR